MKLVILKILAFLSLALIVSYPISCFIDTRFHTYNKQDWILNQKNLSIDYAVIGSSRVFNMVSIPEMDKAWCKNGINLGTSGSNFAEQYILLSEFLKKNKIKMLLINVDEFAFNSSKHYSYPYHDFEFLPLFKNYLNIFSDYIPNWKMNLWRVLPIAKYIEYNSSFIVKTSAHNDLDSAGGSFLEEGQIQDSMLCNKIDMPENYSYNPNDLKYFKLILNKCKIHQVEIIFITTPKCKMDNIIMKNFISGNSFLENYQFVSYEKIFDYNNRHFFKDCTHTNKIGSKVFSHNLGLYLKDLKLIY